MRVLWLILLGAVVAGCSVSPTGNIVSEAIVDGEVLITYAVLSESTPTYPVRINIYGDAVAAEFYIEGEEYMLSGPAGSQGLLRDKGTAIVYLAPGEYRVIGTSCERDVLSVSCSYIGRSIRV